MLRRTVFSILLFVFFWSTASPVLGQEDAVFRPSTPKVWDDREMQNLEVPLSREEFSPRHVPENFYYKIPVRPIYNSYPVYRPDREPPGYIDWLRSREPALAWDAAKLKTKEDWIGAGEVVFESPLGYGSILFTPERLADAEDLYVREGRFYAAVNPPIAADGTLPFYRYVVRKKGTVDIGILSCAMCHTRVMPDGSVVKGAQGNFPFDRAMAYALRSGGNETLELNRKLARLLWLSPWIETEFFSHLEKQGYDEIASAFDSRPGGVLTRHRSGPWAPIQVPDLIGVAQRKYLDHTGLQQNRGPADLMRYAALNQGGDDLSSFGGFVPISELMGPKLDPQALDRYSDEQLYALVQYLNSLRPPANPNRFSEQTAAGEKVFEREGCGGCHTPPLYSNNKLTPASGFEVPPAHRKRYDILDVVVGTDAALALRTRRGTGYYKVSSLRGVWYREFFGHSGECKTLEDWFDPARLNDDYTPTGARPHGAKSSAVRGHEFGLKLSKRDKSALIAFLKTL